MNLNILMTTSWTRRIKHFMIDHFLFQVFIYLVAAVVSVPIAKRLGMGSVLGYLIAGV